MLQYLLVLTDIHVWIKTADNILKQTLCGWIPYKSYRVIWLSLTKVCPFSPVIFTFSPVTHLFSSHFEHALLEHRKPFLHEHFASVVGVHFSAYSVEQKEIQPQACGRLLCFILTTSLGLRFLEIKPLISCFRVTLWAWLAFPASVKAVVPIGKVSFLTGAADSWLGLCAELFQILSFKTQGE